MLIYNLLVSPCMKIKNMSIDDLTIEHLEGIYEIFHETCGSSMKISAFEQIANGQYHGNETHKEDLIKEAILKEYIRDLKENRYLKNRVVSQWKDDSILQIRESKKGNIKIKFKPNFPKDSRYGSRYADAMSGRAEFNKRLSEYFSSFSL